MRWGRKAAEMKDEGQVVLQGNLGVVRPVFWRRTGCSFCVGVVGACNRCVFLFLFYGLEKMR